MQKIIQYLNSPIACVKNSWVIPSVITLTVGFILLVFKPFLMANGIKSMGFHVVTIFTLITAAVSFFAFYVAPLIFKKFFDDDNWVVWKFVVLTFFVIFFIAFFNTLMKWYLLWLNTKKHSKMLGFIEPERFPEMLKDTFFETFLVGIFPIIFSVIILREYHVKSYLKNAESLNNHLKNHELNEDKELEDIKETSTEIKKITFSGSTKESLTILPEQLIYIEAVGNYVNIVYLEEGKTKEQFIRATLTNIEAVLSEHIHIFRCHRAYIVNIDQIKNISGNSHGYLLTLHNSSKEISVSRSYSKIFNEKMEE